ncbi:serine hydrolase domain-containing protein [Lysobacter korlensis]|uniref:Serine hydrolase domain-containing protein n=1 Tax=Lysobacter korlensis TaxID=553636 RepID=A0ABV6RUE0_9GAMM
MERPEVDSIFAACVAALGNREFAHLLGVGIAIGEEVRLGGPAPGVPTDVFSVSKAVVAQGVGEAIRAGVFVSADETLTVPGPFGCRPTVRDLLWMTQPWRADPDMDDVERLPYDPLPEIVAALACTPGGSGRYVNAGMHLLIRELHHRTGNARAFIEQTVLAPAGVSLYGWEADPTGAPWGHAHLHLSVRDVLRIGTHWLGEGTPGGRQDRPTSPMPPESLPYAAGMWLGEGYELAAGWGGQCLMLVPARDAVLVALGDTGWNRDTNSDSLPHGWSSGRSLFERHALPALLH